MLKILCYFSDDLPYPLPEDARGRGQGMQLLVTQESMPLVASNLCYQLDGEGF
jgi:hypothetical protein